MKAFFKRLWDGWMKFALIIGKFNTKLVFTIFYYVLLLPFGLLVRAFSDPLKMKMTPKPSNWLDRDTRDKTLADLQKQS